MTPVFDNLDFAQDAPLWVLIFFNLILLFQKPLARVFPILATGFVRTRSSTKAHQLDNINDLIEKDIWFQRQLLETLQSSLSWMEDHVDTIEAEERQLLQDIRLRLDQIESRLTALEELLSPDRKDQPKKDES